MTNINGNLMTVEIQAGALTTGVSDINSFDNFDSVLWN